MYKKNMKKGMKIFLSLVIIGLFIVAGASLVVAAQDLLDFSAAAFENIYDAFKRLTHYIIGPVPEEMISEYGATSAWIIILAIWTLILITFADVIETFSSFGHITSVAVAFLVAVIAANTRLIAGSVITMTGWFVQFGTAAIYIALGIAFVAFVAANSGLWFLSKWIMQRKAMMMAAKAAAGGTKLKAGIKGLKEAGAELAK